MRFIYFLVVIHIIACNSDKADSDKLKTAMDFIRSDKISEADSIYKTIANRKRTDFDYKLFEVILLCKQEKYEKLLEKSVAFAEQFPYSTFGYYYAGISQYNLIQYESALSYFKQSLSKLGNINGGAIFIEKGKDYSTNFSEASIYNDLVYMLGVSECANGRYNTSIEYLQTSVGSRYRLSESYFAVGYCYERLKDLTNAKHYYLLAKQNGHPDADEWLKKLGR